MTTQEAIDQLKYLSRLTKKEDAIYFSNRDAEAIDTVVKKLEKPTYTAEDMEEFSFWYHRKVSVIGESELHLFGVRPFGDIIDFWKKERRAK